jgi:hypothetical protein
VVSGQPYFYSPADKQGTGRSCPERDSDTSMPDRTRLAPRCDGVHHRYAQAVVLYDGDWLIAQKACANLERFDILRAIACLRMRVRVVYVETCAITISMTSTCGNKDFWLEFLDFYRTLPVLWHGKSEINKNRNFHAEGYETVVRKSKEINPDEDREMTAERAESLIEILANSLKILILTLWNPFSK